LAVARSLGRQPWDRLAKDDALMLSEQLARRLKVRWAIT
jgi:putative ABC transport system permease protein